MRDVFRAAETKIALRNIWPEAPEQLMELGVLNVLPRDGGHSTFLWHLPSGGVITLDTIDDTWKFNSELKETVVSAEEAQRMLLDTLHHAPPPSREEEDEEEEDIFPFTP